MNMQLTSPELLDSVLHRQEELYSCNAVVDDALIMQHVIDSCLNVFATMCKLDVASKATSSACPKLQTDLTSMVSISGSRQVSIAVKFSKEVAIVAVNNLLGVRAEAIDADVLDLVGEIGNMIAGGVKERCDNSKLTLGLPTVITGQGHRVLFDKGMNKWTIDFECEAGDLQIELGIAP